MRIAETRIGPERGPYIIAELGVNHDGSVSRALELTRAAAAAGADAIKLQLFRADLLMSSAAKLAAYQRAAGERDPLAMLRKLEMSARDMEPIVSLAHGLGLHAIVTVFSVELVGEADTLAWDAYKTASPDVIHRPLLERLAATGRPLIVSTGASTPDEVRRAVAWLEGERDRTALLQCVSSYPTPLHDAELGGIGALGVFGLPVGYSDHTAEIQTGAQAAALGACILEKHLTYDRGAPGPDHAASLEPDGLAAYVRLARSAAREVVLPSTTGHKRVLERERDVRLVSRQSIVTTRAIAAEEVLGRGDLTFKRPGTGLEPWMLGEVVGRRAARAIAADVPVVEADLGAPAHAGLDRAKMAS